MTQAVAQILGEFEQLSEMEQRELRLAIVERVPMTGDLSDDDYAALAAGSFRALDEAEDAACLSVARSGRWIWASRRRSARPW